MTPTADTWPLERVRVVLCRPSEPRNIGAACRATKAAGITHLSIVSATPVDKDAARPVAVGAADLLDAAPIVATLPEALAGAALVAGVTRRTGQKRKAVSYPPCELAKRICEMGGGAAALVFGNEQSGLSDEELAHCHMAVSIPTNPAFPSLNLSHAVQIIVYELYKESVTRAGRKLFVPTDRARLAAEVETIIRALNELGFATQEGPQGMRTFLTDILARASVGEAEAERFRALFEKLAGMRGERTVTKPGHEG